ncbi:hypothetical protein [Anaerophilus nitritogenes]|uniref:hypothetical protein n=1 Tax=Anaerophilus nitritogenes TaxID=2498136 RepID=UPI00101C0C75|nr:hypothetical protein [Anaerophilus nitritogenes]
MLYEKVFEKLPNLKTIVESRAEEIATQKILEKEEEIHALKKDREVLAQNVLDLTNVVEAILTGGVHND